MVAVVVRQMRGRRLSRRVEGVEDIWRRGRQTRKKETGSRSLFACIVCSRPVWGVLRGFGGVRACCAQRCRANVRTCCAMAGYDWEFCCFGSRNQGLCTAQTSMRLPSKVASSVGWIPGAFGCGVCCVGQRHTQAAATRADPHASPLKLNFGRGVTHTVKPLDTSPSPTHLATTLTRPSLHSPPTGLAINVPGLYPPPLCHE